ncbi:hypothetical protein D6789_04055, partial [Candidatus Woesearchaeota archaeon]
AAERPLPKNLSRCQELLALHDAFQALSSKPTPEALVAFKQRCLALQQQPVRTPFEQLLWDIVERYRSITEEILF